MDYQSNSKKSKLEQPKPEKKIERVVTGEVIVQRKSLGRKFKDLFIMADFRSVMHYVVAEVLLPAARNTVVDASAKGIERLMYGESARRRGVHNYGGPRITYNNSPLRPQALAPGRTAPPISSGPRGATRTTREDFILATREEAELVLERMNDVVEHYDVVSIADLNELVGFPSSHIDNKWGWSYLGDVQIRQTREGFLIDLPPADPLN